MVPAMKTLPGLALYIALTGLACDNEPAKGKTHAKVSEPVAAATPEPNAAAAAVTYAFSEVGSSFEFVGAKVTAKHDGKFGAFRGTVQLVDNDATKSRVSAEVDLGSLTADNPKLTGHLKSPDFFNVEKFPNATFKSTSIRAGGEGGATHTVTGNLDLHGVTKQISFPAKVTTSADAVNVDAEFAINRKDFGIVYPGMANDLIKDEVLLKLKLNAKKG